MSKIVFFGTPNIAADTLKIISQHHEVLLTLTQPDKKKNRGQKLCQSAVADLSNLLNIPVIKPTDLKDQALQEKLSDIEADFFVVISYGRILPRSILQIPRKACLNIHYSLLPRWRGASPIQSALLNGDQETGISIIKMIEQLDAGNILIKKTVQIEDQDNATTLTGKLAQIGNQSLLEVLQNFDNIEDEIQIEEHTTYAALIAKNDMKINWNQSATSIYNQFKAFSPQPNIFSYFRNKRIKIIDCCIIVQEEQTHHTNTHNGSIISFDQKKIVIKTREGLLGIKTLQPEGKKVMILEDFINGYQIKVGETFYSPEEQ